MITREDIMALGYSEDDTKWWDKCVATSKNIPFENDDHKNAFIAFFKDAFETGMDHLVDSLGYFDIELMSLKPTDGDRRGYYN